MISVAIGDDHQMFTDGLRDGFGALPDIRVQATAADAPGLIACVRETPVDVVLVDLEMPGGGGMEVLRVLDGTIPTMVVTMHVTPETAVVTTRAKAVALFSKGAKLKELAAGVRAVHAGRRIPNEEPDRSDTLREFWDPPIDPGAALLTEREIEVLNWLAKGVSQTDDLADRMFISQKTVKNHLASIYSKLSVSDRTQAAIEAIRLGLARPK